MALAPAKGGTSAAPNLRDLVELECDTSAVSNAARLIREGVSAGKAAAESGFADYSAFHRAFRESFGTSPGKLAGRK